MGRLAKGVRELNEEELKEVELATGETTTSTSGVSQVQGEEWRERVVRDAEERRRMEQVAATYDDLTGSGDDTLHIPRTTGHLDITAENPTEGSSRTYTQLDNIETVDVTISGSDFELGGIAISKQTMMTSNVDMVAEARNAVAQEMAQNVDIALRDEAESASTTASHNVDQTTSGELTPDSISKAMEYIETDNYEPRWLVINPAQKHDLRTDSQFTNASEYGNREVVANGEIGTYLGVRVMESTQISKKAIMVGAKRNGDLVGPALVWKERPTVNTGYDREESEQRIYYDQTYTTTTVQEDAVATIQTQA